MDDLDRAQQEIEHRLARCLEQINTTNEVQSTGYCLNCDETLTEPERRWCNADCRDDWEARNRARKQNGHAN